MLQRQDLDAQELHVQCGHPSKARQLLQTTIIKRERRQACHHARDRQLLQRVTAFNIQGFEQKSAQNKSQQILKLIDFF